MKKPVIKNDVLNRYFNAMIEHKKSNTRQAAYLQIVKMANKRKLHRSELRRLLNEQINKKNYSTNVLYLSIKFVNLVPSLYITDDEKVVKYIEDGKVPVSETEVRYLVKLYLFRSIASDGLRHLISTFII